MSTFASIYRLSVLLFMGVMSLSGDVINTGRVPNSRSRMIRGITGITGNHAQANGNERYLELYIVNDFSQFKAFGYDEPAVIQRTRDMVDIVNQIYRQLNISVVLVGVEIWKHGNLINITESAEKTMNNFLEYRRTKINPRYPNDNAQLITAGILGEGVVGKAPIMTICSQRHSGGVSADRSHVVGAVAATLAHEIGHNLGLQHDDVSECECPDSRCIMTSSGGGERFATRWSECSRQQLSDSFHLGMDYCLHNKPLPDRVYGQPTCGNGVVELGEDCDCGLFDRDSCDKSCCDPKTCRLAVNSTCASGPCCDLNTCQPMSAGMQCRASSGGCDLEEYCDGQSPECPSDVYLQDGEQCTIDGVSSYCYSGQCHTHHKQCQRLWGSTGRSSHPLCYQHLNLLGTVNGHCGFQQTDEKFVKCQAKDVMCGMLQCEHLSEKLMFWRESLAYSLPETYVTSRDGQRYDCKGAILEVGLDTHDPGSVQDGTKCGDEQICLRHHCVEVASLNRTRCPDCNNRGVCNNLGQCHCDPGYEPPYCAHRGNGGSIHSGGPIRTGYQFQPGIGLVAGLLIVGVLVTSSLGVALYSLFTYRSRIKLFVMRQVRHHRYGPVRRTFTAVQSAVDTASKPPVKRSASVRRAPSFRSEDISTPRLQSSTNSAVACLLRHDELAISSIPSTNDEDNPTDLSQTRTSVPEDQEALVLTISETAKSPERLRPTRKAPFPPGTSSSRQIAMSATLGSKKTGSRVAMVTNQNCKEWTSRGKLPPVGESKRNIASVNTDSSKPVRPPPPKKYVANGDSGKFQSSSTVSESLNSTSLKDKADDKVKDDDGSLTMRQSQALKDKNLQQFNETNEKPRSADRPSIAPKPIAAHRRGTRPTKTGSRPTR